MFLTVYDRERKMMMHGWPQHIKMSSWHITWPLVDQLTGKGDQLTGGHGRHGWGTLDTVGEVAWLRSTGGGCVSLNKENKNNKKWWGTDRQTEFPLVDSTPVYKSSKNENFICRCRRTDIWKKLLREERWCAGVFLSLELLEALIKLWHCHPMIGPHVPMHNCTWVR